MSETDNQQPQTDAQLAQEERARLAKRESAGLFWLGAAALVVIGLLVMLARGGG